MKLTGEKRSTLGKTYPSATLSTTNPTWNDPELNPVLRFEWLAANRLNHGTAICRLNTTKYRRMEVKLPLQNTLKEFMGVGRKISLHCL
jgi:hypothetical protein